MKGLFLAEAGTPSTSLGESWQGDKAREDGGRSPPPPRHTSTSNSDSHCQCSASISPPMACSPPSQPPCPASHLRAPRLRSAGAVPATATQSLARLDVGGHPRDDLGLYKPPQRGSRCGWMWRPLMPKRKGTTETEIFRIG